MRRLLLLLMALMTVPCTAQTDAVPPPTPKQSAVPADAALNPKLPTVFVVGDSTARNGMDLGWGDHFAALFDTSRINVANRARAGRSARSYYNEGLWAKVVAEMKPGDFVLIQMGHNDGRGTPDAVVKDTKFREDLSGVGDETVDVTRAQAFSGGPLAGQTVEPVHTYGWYLRKYIADTRACGATPILLTVTVRNIWTDGKVERDMGFRADEEKVAGEEHVALVDVGTISADRLQTMGQEKAAALYPVDHTHTSAVGAEANARDVAAALVAAGSPVAAYLK